MKREKGGARGQVILQTFSISDIVSSSGEKRAGGHIGDMQPGRTAMVIVKHVVVGMSCRGVGVGTFFQRTGGGVVCGRWERGITASGYWYGRTAYALRDCRNSAAEC